MSLTPGGRLGPFEISGASGAGGMGEVYRARDTKLNRDVAIKVLPTAFGEMRRAPVIVLNWTAELEAKREGQR